jgi:protein-tyrosine phosphatase
VRHLTVYEVTKGLYVSPRSDRVPVEGKVPQLKALGVERIVNLWSGRDEQLAAAFDYVHYPIADGKHVPEELPLLATLIVDLVTEDRGVLIQCHGGRNRSALLAGLVLREWWDFDGEEAVAWMLRARPNALANDAFITWLMGMERGGRA